MKPVTVTRAWNNWNRNVFFRWPARKGVCMASSLLCTLYFYSYRYDNELIRSICTDVHEVNSFISKKEVGSSKLNILITNRKRYKLQTIRMFLDQTSTLLQFLMLSTTITGSHNYRSFLSLLSIINT